MWQFNRSSGKFVALCTMLSFIAIGCGPPNNGLSKTTTVELPDGTVQEVTLGSGVISFADSEWEFFRVAGSSAQIAPFVVIIFGPEGELAAFENNTIAQEIFGATILFDGQRHNTTQPGLQYAAATFGAATADATGFAFEGEITAFAAGFEAANATASAVGEFEGDDIDTIRGTFSFSSRVTLLDIPEGNLDEEFPFVGRRVE